jgi:anti-sigma regulatory factor (Ser/Thr protein kinase)
MIILTGSSTRDDVISAMRDHAFSYFTEPFSAEELAASVENAMNSPAWDDGIELISANSTWIRLFARCDLGTADRLTHFIFEVTDDLAEEERTSVSIAFHELLLNAMEHGGKFDLGEYVEISYLRSRRAVSCRIKDPGRGFSLTEVRHAAVMNPPEDPLRHLTYREAQNMRAGGYGILLARHLIDEMIYSEKGNDVVLIKYIDRNDPSNIAESRGAAPPHLN